MASYLLQTLSDWSAVLFSVEKLQVGLLSLCQVKRYDMSIVMFLKCYKTLVFSHQSSVSFNKGCRHDYNAKIHVWSRLSHDKVMIKTMSKIHQIIT